MPNRLYNQGKELPKSKTPVKRKKYSEEQVEAIEQALKENTSGIIQPLNETPVDAELVDNGFYKEAYYEIRKSPEGNYKGFAHWKYNGMNYLFTTEIRNDISLVWKQLKARIDLVVKHRKMLSKNQSKIIKPTAEEINEFSNQPIIN